MRILVLNSGSSSIKFQLFEMQTKTSLASGLVEQIGSNSSRAVLKANGEIYEIKRFIKDHHDGLEAMNELFTTSHTLHDLSELDANLKIAAPIQFDAAVDLSVASKKMPNSNVAGQANVFIFPNLNCGNICYKAVQRSANALAVGPILQGLKKPVNDLSRGCLVEDVVNTILISAIQAGE